MITSKEKKPISVTALTEYIKSLLERDLNLSNVLLLGEISNLTMHRTGHIYLKLKDEKSIISGVMFRSDASSLQFEPKNGMRVIISGRISVFGPSGNYQIYINKMQPDGIGDLYLAYEQLKDKLLKEGLFDPKYKKLIPKTPLKIGIITSPTGAAIRDMINILKRRFPLANVLLYPSLVQGDNAAPQLIKALDYFDNTGDVDLVIIGRGGGSIEDLWAFNDERLARKIFEMNTPVISAVGHETDYTICDFIADLRAPTPSAAAELAVPDTVELMEKFENVNRHMRTILLRRLQGLEEKYNYIKSSTVFKDSSQLINHRQMLVDHNVQNICRQMQIYISKADTQFSKLASTLDALSPLRVLNRGYLFAQKQDKSLVKSIANISEGEVLDLKLSDGLARCSVDKIIKLKSSAQNRK